MYFLSFESFVFTTFQEINTVALTIYVASLMYSSVQMLQSPLGSIAGRLWHKCTSALSLGSQQPDAGDIVL